MMRETMAIAALGLALAMGATAGADVLGPEWVESDNGGEDAGSNPDDAQETVGIGQLASIRGKLQALEPLTGGPADLEDVYIICVQDPDSFMATTAVNGGFSEFDSRLYLFDLIGFGQLGNDIPEGCEQSGEPLCEGSTLGNQSTDGTGIVVDQSGLYLLAITVTPCAPISSGGPIFATKESGGVSGPDGPGGGLPLIDWEGGPDGTGCPGSGDCFEPNQTPGCEDPMCCETVCAVDPFCCDDEWDKVCASAAFELCEYDGGVCPGSGNCFEPNGTPGCEDELCCSTVCDIDPFCCDAEWDSSCVRLASRVCRDVPAPAMTAESVGAGGVSGDGGGDYVIMLEGVCFATSVPTGGCELPGGVCQNTTQFDCRMLGGVFLGNGNPCDVTDCNSNGIPDDVETAPENDPLDAMAADDCADADFICTDILYDGHTFAATHDATVFCDLIYGGEYDVWYRYRPKSSGVAVAKVCEFDFGLVDGAPARPIVSVHDGCPGNEGNQIACNFASAVGTNCNALWNAEAGHTYWIRIAGQDDTRGSFSLEIKGPRCLPNPSDFNENGIPDDCECLADVNGDGVVDADDLTAVMRRLGNACEECPEDVNVDGVVDEEDLQRVLSSLGPCP